MDIPNEIWLKICTHCDIPCMYQLMMTCKRLYSCCSTEIVWFHQWLKLISDFQKICETDFTQYSDYNYKALCLKFVKIFGFGKNTSDYLCCKCQGVLCSTKCIETSDELIIFDFGSKTTWFKYESENTGQLSMHPTVAPLEDVVSDISSSTSEEELLLTDSCPVCSKILRKRNNALQTGGFMLRDKKKFSNAFTRLSLKGLHCFESSQFDCDEPEYTSTALTNPLADTCTDKNNTHTTPLLCGFMTLIPGETSTLRDIERCPPKSVLDTSKALENYSHSSIECSSGIQCDAVSPEQNNVVNEEDQKSSCDILLDHTLLQRQQVQTLIFLMTHMLKRNAFSPEKNIPFVVCEPLHFDLAMKKQLVKHLFEDLKVPGLCFVSKPVAVALYTGLDTCLVVDSGANNTTVTPVVNQCSVNEARQWKPVGGRHISAHLKDCIQVKAAEFEVDESNIDSSQVKRECWLAFNPDSESRKKLPSKNITIKGRRGEESEHFQVALSHELYVIPENMYLNLKLPDMINKSVEQFDTKTKSKLLSNIILSGGNCRLNGLANRLTRDLQTHVEECSNSIRVCDPRLMTGRTDVVVGASYVKRLDWANWITRQQYILHGFEDVVDDIH